MTKNCSNHNHGSNLQNKPMVWEYQQQATTDTRQRSGSPVRFGNRGTGRHWLGEFHERKGLKKMGGDTSPVLQGGTLEK